MPINVEDDRIQMQISSTEHMFIFKVDLPCVNHRYEIFVEYVNKLYDLYCTYSEKGTTIFIGDFNASIIRGNLLSRDRYFAYFMSNCNMCPINLLNCCLGATDTSVSYDDSCMSTIDYIVMPVEIIDQITYCEVADDNCLNISRHRPILCCLGVKFDNANAFDSYVFKRVKVVRHIEMPKAAPKSPFVIFKN